MYPDDRRYSRQHEWIQRDGDAFVLGITEFAQAELGDVVFVELPAVGARFEADAEIGNIESVKAVAELYTPIAGAVVAVNGKVTDAPELLNEDPHGEGWLLRLRADDPDALEGLLSASEYQELVDQG